MYINDDTKKNINFNPWNNARRNNWHVYKWWYKKNINFNPIEIEIIIDNY